MRRREFIAWIGGGTLAWPLAAGAQKVHRVGVLFTASGEGSVPDQAFRSGLRERGYVEGQNITFEFRTAAGKYDDLPRLATELVALNLDVIFAPAEAALRACLQVAHTIPIVIAAAEYDPVEVGLITSIARPGGKVTGVIFSQVETSAKRVELLKEVAPAISRVAVFVEAGGKFQLQEVERAARSLGIALRIFDLRGPVDIDTAFEAALHEQAGGLVVLVSPVTYANRAKIASLAIQNRFPAIAPFGEFTDDGGLLSYGASLATMFHYVAAHYVARILQGTQLADLPIEQPTKLEFSINLRTARAIGLTVPPHVLAIADRVIE
jgi:putative tryptophan/tyrosine transport system substrate-binding protein